jgi:hypothetical protein
MARSPDVAAAVERLEAEGVLGPGEAAHPGHIARGELVSLNRLLHAMLYAGVLAATSGAGLLLKDRIEDLGPVALALLIAAAAGACLAWVWKTAPPWTPDRATGAGIAQDYILLLGALLLAADLGFCEYQFTPLGSAWPWHLLFVSLIYAALALRFDSRLLFALALTTFAAWRGVSSLRLDQALLGWEYGSDLTRANALGCGALFLLVGAWCDHRRVKPHFEPVAAFTGWALILTAAALGLDERLSRFALLALGVTLAWCSRGRDRFAFLVMGVLAAYVAFLAMTLGLIDSGAGSMLFVALTALLLLALLIRVRRRVEAG